jgi:hypothetical protein
MGRKHKHQKEKHVSSSSSCVDANEEKTVYMYKSRHQTAGQNHYIKLYNQPFENVKKLKYIFGN